MARPTPDDDEPQLDPGLEKVRRKLVRFIAINLGLLFLALMVVIAALVYKSRSAKAPAQASTGEIPVPAAGEQISGDIVLPVGAKVVSQSLSGNRLSIDAELADGAHAIFIYDVAEQRMIGHFSIRNK